MLHPVLLSLTIEGRGQQELTENYEDFILKCVAWLPALLMLACSFPACAQSQDKAMRLALLLFPEASNLHIVGEMQRLTKLDMTPTLIAGLISRLPPKSRMAQVCGGPPFTGADPASFAHISFNGQQSVIYEGPTACAEGDTSVLWPGPRAIVAPDALEITGDLLLIGDGPQPYYVDFISGCCGDPDAQYIFSQLVDPFPEHFTVREDLKLPGGMTGFGSASVRPLRFIKSAFLLRNAPVADNTLNPNVRGPGLPVGNILKRYAPGTCVVALSQWIDKTGQLWVLVSVPADGDTGCVRQIPAFISQSYDDANVGWTEVAEDFLSHP